MLAITSNPGALDLFWFPMFICILGLILSITRNYEKIKTLGVFLTIIGIIFISISPYTLPSSPSSAFGQLISLLIGPLALMIIAIIFSYRYELNNFGENVKSFLIIIAILWILLIWIISPEINDLPNKYWQIWIISIQIIFACILFIQSYNQTTINTKFLFLILGVTFLLLNEENLNIPNSSRKLFIEVLGILVGTLFGVLLGLIIWYYTIQIIYSFENELEMDSELSSEERTILFEKLYDDLNWIENYNDGDKHD